MSEKRVKFYKFMAIILLVAAIVFAITTTIIVNIKQKNKDKIEDDIGQIPKTQIEMLLK